MPGSKITKALARRLAQSKGQPVIAVVYAAIDSDTLTLSSFAARAQQRNAAVKTQLERLMGRVQEWEKESGQPAGVTFRPEDAAIVLTAPAALFEWLAGDAAVAALDIDGATG